MNLSAKQQLFTHNIGLLIGFAYASGYKLSFGHAWRSSEEQERLLREGLSHTSASNHLNRLAVDFNVFYEGKLTWDWQLIKPLGDFWESLHPKNRWGGDWNGNNLKDGFVDAPHFEMRL